MTASLPPRTCPKKGLCGGDISIAVEITTFVQDMGGQ